MANASARDDLAQLFNDDLLGMDAGVGDAAAEEKAREALSHSMFADERRGDGGGTPGRNDGGRDARVRGSPGGVLGGGNPRGGDRRGHDDRGVQRVGGGVVPGPRAPGGRHREDRHGRHGGTPHRNDRGRDHARDARHGEDRDAPSRGDLSRFDDARGDDDDFDFDSEDESERREWPSPADLLADARSILDAADGALMRDGRAPSAENMARLDRELRRIVSQQRTTPHDDQKRQNLLRRFQNMLDKKFAGVSCAPFGSYVSVFHTAGSDIDLSLEVDPQSPWYDAKEMAPGGGAGAGGRGSRGGNRRHPPPRGYKSKKVQLLSKVASELRYQRFAEVNLIAHARVPLIKFFDPSTGVNCDVCVGNDGVYKSAVLGAFADLDERYRDLVFLVKMWAKRFDCNDATAGSFNSFALSLMSMFHLQTRSPPILPPVLRLTLPTDAAADADLAAERERANNLEPVRKTPVSKIRQQSDATRDVSLVAARAASPRWRGFGAANPATLAELLVTFFTHFRSVEPLWKHGLVASTYAGRWVAGAAWAPGRYCVGVEDPFAAGDNVARSIQRRSLPKVLSAVRDGTLAMARVCWADSDEDLARALYDLLGAGAAPPREMPQSGWPTLGGAGGNEPLNSPGAGGRAEPGPGTSPGQRFGMDAFGGGAGGAPPGAPPLGANPVNPLNAGLLNLLTGGVGAPPGMMGPGAGPGVGPAPPGPGGTRGAGLFGPPQGGVPVGMPVGVHAQGHPPGLGFGGVDGAYERFSPGAESHGGAPPAFFERPHDPQGLGPVDIARALDRVQLDAGGPHGEQPRGGDARDARAPAPPGYARRRETPPGSDLFLGGAPNGGTPTLTPLESGRAGGALVNASLPSPNGSPGGGGEDAAAAGAGKSRRGRGRGGKSANAARGGGKGDRPGAGPKTLPKPRIAPQAQ